VIRIKESISKERLQYQVFIALSAAVLGLTGVVYSLDDLVFQKYLGGINPLATGFLVIVLGFLLFSFLLSKGWFAIYKKENVKGLYYSSGLATLFGLVAILADFEIRFYAADINILFPKSLLFYPAMGFYVEILFQVLPLVLILTILTPLSKRNSNKIMWIGIFVVSLFEPIFQILPLTSGQFPLWFAAFELARIFTIVLSQMTFFKRYDFVTMYWFRIVYYILWHIIWGYLRLGLLF
jgi:hypothetical protein